MSPPASPLIVVGPVLVIVEPARTAKLEVVPRSTGGWAAIAAGGTTSMTVSSSGSRSGTGRIFLSVLISRFDLPLSTLHAYIPLILDALPRLSQQATRLSDEDSRLQAGVPQPTPPLLHQLPP